MSLSTHVLDAVTGSPAVGVAVEVHRVDDGTVSVAPEAPVASATTGADGRVADLASGLTAGVYRLRFDTGAYYAGETFYPEVVVTFTIADPSVHLHVPLLLSPYAYSTYRGS